MKGCNQLNFSEIKYYLRNTPGISKIYNKFVSNVKGDKFRCDSIPKIVPDIMDNYDNLRVNLIVPSFESDFVYGGLTTAIKIFKEVYVKLNADARIIVLKGQYSSKSTHRVEGFDYNGDNKNILFLDDSKKVPVCKNDIFICTFWTTMYAITPIFKQQIDYFKLNDRKIVYLIQDFEPGFYPWSTEYALADSTYKNNSNNIVAMFNAESLYRYFKNGGYSFGEEIFFDPQMNENLRRNIPRESNRRLKKILIYGRPRVSRNSFELIRSSLALWSDNYEKANEWEIISLGAKFEDIRLSRNVISSKGKVTLDEYAKYMSEAYVGISLMISPHPSYPPLEMSTFGVKTITNKFDSKDLNDFNSNIYNVDFCTPDEIEKQLEKICDQYYSDPYGMSYRDNDYVKGGSFEKAIDNLISSIKNMEV